MRRTDRDPSLPSPPVVVRRRLTLSLALVALVLAGLSAAGPAAASTSAQEDDSASDAETAPTTAAEPAGAPVFDVVQVSGILDEIVADFIEDSIGAAADADSGGLVLQVSSTHATVSDGRIVELADAIVDSPVPVYGWVGPSGAKAEREVAQLVGVTDQLSVAVGSRFGNLGELVIPEDRFRPDFLAAVPALTDRTVDEDGAIELGISDRDAPTLGFFVLDLPGFASEVDDSGDEPVRVPTSPVRFSKLSLVDGWMHNFASPAMAYLLFLVAGALLVFEFYTAGIGIAGAVGAVCLVLSCYGLAELPTRPWAIALLVLSILGYAVDVQTGVPRFWSVFATVCLVIGSLFLYDGLSLSWITLLAGFVGLPLAMVSGMPAMVRTRFGTPTIGREWMIGEMGVATSEIRKEGVVVIDGAPWKARVNRTTPIPAGDPVRVVAIEGLYLEVEPEEGGARDYREMRKPSSPTEN